MRNFILFLTVLLTGCYHVTEERYITTSLPQGQGPNADMVIVRVEYISEGKSTIKRRVHDKFDREDVIVDDYITEIDTLARYDVLHLDVDAENKMRTRIYTTVHRGDTLLEILWFKMCLENKHAVNDIVIN